MTPLYDGGMDTATALNILDDRDSENKSDAYRWLRTNARHALDARSIVANHLRRVNAIDDGIEADRRQAERRFELTDAALDAALMQGSGNLAAGNARAAAHLFRRLRTVDGRLLALAKARYMMNCTGGVWSSCVESCALDVRTAEALVNAMTGWTLER